MSREFPKKYKVIRESDIIGDKIIISKEQAKLIATSVAPHIKSYIESHRAEYEEWLKEQKLAEITQPKKLKSKGA